MLTALQILAGAGFGVSVAAGLTLTFVPHWLTPLQRHQLVNVGVAVMALSAALGAAVL